MATVIKPKRGSGAPGSGALAQYEIAIDLVNHKLYYSPDGTTNELLSGDQYSDADVDTHLNVSTATTNDYLKWNGADYEWDTVPAGYTDADVDTHLNQSTATTDQVLSWTGSDYAWVDTASGISNVVEDTTPQLGGDLDVNDNAIVNNGSDSYFLIGANTELTGGDLFSTGNLTGAINVSTATPDNSNLTVTGGRSGKVTLTQNIGTGGANSERVRFNYDEAIIDPAGYDLTTSSNGRGFQGKFNNIKISQSDSGNTSDVGTITGQFSYVNQGSIDGTLNIDRLNGVMAGIFINDSDVTIGDVKGFAYERYSSFANLTGTEYSFYSGVSGAELYNEGPATLSGLSYPTSDGTQDQVLVTDGAGNLSFADAVASIDDLNDVDTTTTTPSIGQVLEWDGSNFVPGDNISEVIDDTTPELGGTLDVNGFAITGGSDSGDKIVLQTDRTGGEFGLKLELINDATFAGSVQLLGYTFPGQQNVFQVNGNTTSERMLRVMRDTAGTTTEQQWYTDAGGDYNIRVRDNGQGTNATLNFRMADGGINIRDKDNNIKVKFNNDGDIIAEGSNQDIGTSSQAWDTIYVDNVNTDTIEFSSQLGIGDGVSIDNFGGINAGSLNANADSNFSMSVGTGYQFQFQADGRDLAYYKEGEIELLTGLRLGNCTTGATDPVSATEGDLFINTSDSNLKRYNGTTWDNLTQSAGTTVFSTTDNTIVFYNGSGWRKVTDSAL